MAQQPAVDVTDGPRCAARGCREVAVLELRWRNPTLHDATRVKIWPACPAHADSLADFLGRRGFLLGREPIEVSRADPPAPPVHPEPPGAPPDAPT